MKVLGSPGIQIWTNAPTNNFIRFIKRRPDILLSTEPSTEVMFDLAVTILLMATSNSRCDKAPWGRVIRFAQFLEFFRDENELSAWKLLAGSPKNHTIEEENHLKHPAPWLWVQHVNFPGCHGFKSSSMDAIGKQNNQSAHHKHKFDEVQPGRWDSLYT